MNSLKHMSLLDAEIWRPTLTMFDEMQNAIFILSGESVCFMNRAAFKLLGEVAVRRFVDAN